MARLSWTEMRRYGTHWCLSVAFGSFPRSVSSRCCMKAVTPGLWSTQYQIWTTNQNWTSSSAISASSSERQVQRQMNFIGRKSRAVNRDWSKYAGLCDLPFTIHYSRHPEQLDYRRGPGPRT